eukprot:TRINITY_DN7247_c0_g2_i3.p1 TRINITY_DN7247_c0_g2~~TRINITY_DN7247_c0_g2_i3.p1  ORF type:complete len:555 (-),score=125.65 TRINITY_DN7247_c0_g2_i3:59-1525(-)
MSVIIYNGDKCVLADRKVAIYSESQANPDGKKTTASNRNWYLVPGTCVTDSYDVAQLHVLTQAEGEECTSTRCKGHLRWSGNFDNILFAPTKHGHLRGSSQTEDKLGFEFDFPFEREGIISRTNPATHKLECWYFDLSLHKMGLTTDTSKCLKFNVKAALPGPPEYEDASVVTLARFDMNAVAFYDKSTKARSMSLAERRQMALDVGIHMDKREQFFKMFDPFFADLGVTGRRRFRRGGKVVRILPDGQVMSAPSSPIVFPLLPSTRLLSHKYISMSLYFELQKIGFQALKLERTYVLMSFARTTGCLVYLTGTGLIGVKCYNQGKEMIAEQVTNWPHPDFTLMQGTHKVTLLFSTNPTQPVRLYVDGMCVLTIINPNYADKTFTWDLTQASPSLRLFGDQFFWEYYGMWGIMKRFSLQVSDSFKALQDLAETLHLDEVVPLDKEERKYLSRTYRLETSWENCQTVVNETTHFVDGITIYIHISNYPC